MVVLLYIFALLWIISLFSFARLRTSMAGRRIYFSGQKRDFVFTAYLRISGIIILFAVLFLSGIR